MSLKLPIIGKVTRWYWWGLSYFLLQLVVLFIIYNFFNFTIDSPGIFFSMESYGAALCLMLLGAPVPAVILAYLTKTRQFGLGMVSACVLNWLLITGYLIVTL